MKLHFKKTGEGQPFIILHGLFGSGDNWATFARHLSTHGFAVYAVDLRNHGHSPWNDVHDYNSMADDVHELISSENLGNAIVLGHSMGGKAAMQLAVSYPADMKSLIVADIAPHAYAPHHQTIIKGLKSLDLDEIKTRGEAENQLDLYINDIGERQFLLKSLYWKENEKLAFRFNLETLSREIENVGEEIKPDHPVLLRTLFMAGEKSGYIKPEDHQHILQLFPNAEIVTIQNAGHWIHADQPALMMEKILSFLK